MTKYLTVKDIVRRRKFFFFESERLRLKSLIYNRALPRGLRRIYAFQLSSLPRNSSKVRIKNRCLVTHRGQSVYRFFGLTRIALKEFVSFNRIGAITKSSW